MKKMLPLLLVLLLSVSMVGCGEKPEEPIEQPPVYIPSAYLTAEQVEEAVGFAVSEPEVLSNGEVAYFSEDGSAVVYAAMRKATLAEFETMTADATAVGSVLDEAPHLGEKAFWCEEQLDLLVYAYGFALDVRVEYRNNRPNDSLLAARHLAALIIEQV